MHPRSLLRFKRYKIRVNAIEPGLFGSDITVDPSTGKLWGIMEREAREVIPAGRCGNHIEIAGPVMMLATPAGNYINGQIISVDGAWTLVSLIQHANRQSANKLSLRLLRISRTLQAPPAEPR